MKRFLLLIVSAAACHSTTLPIETHDLEPSDESRLEVSAPSGGRVEVDMREHLACDGVWRWRAERVDDTRLVISLTDENRAVLRKACASARHQRVEVSVPKGTYHVHVSMPPGYVTLDRDVVVG